MQCLAIRTCAVSMLVLAGCVGRPAVLGFAEDEGSGDGEGEGDEASSANDDGISESGASEESDDGPAPACEGDSFGVTLRASLTATQYDATIDELTGVNGAFAAGTADAQVVGPFGLGIGEAAAAALASDVAAAVDLGELLPCDPELIDAGAQQDCFDAFVPGFARLAWRRPLAGIDLSAQAAAFAGTGTFDVRMRAVIASVLAAPEFVMLARSGAPTEGDNTLLVLDAHALATRLAMFLWNAGPDAQLLALADSGELLEPAVLHAEAERLLADERAARMVDDFHTQWLGLDGLADAAKSPEVFPEFGPSHAASMLRGTQLFARSVVLGGSGRIEDLFTLPSSFANAELAAIYGDDIVGPVPDGEPFEAVALDPARRGGLLTEPSFVTTHAHADRIGFTPRGKLIRENLLCNEIPPPPPTVDPTLPPDGGGSHKEQWHATFGEPACAGCHVLMDPLGFAFDNYDAIGRWTDEIDGMPVDPSSEGPEYPYANREELIAALLDGDAMPACVVQQYVRYALDRDPDETSDACLLESLEQTLADSDGNVRALMLALVDSDAFRVARVQ